MFLLDTNVVSELRRPHRTNPNVAAWTDAVPASDMFLSSITILELETGALLLKRRDDNNGSRTAYCRPLPSVSSPSTPRLRGDVRRSMFPIRGPSGIR